MNSQRATDSDNSKETASPVLPTRAGMAEAAGSKPLRVLLVRPDRLGDLVLSLPAAAAIKAANPLAHVSFLVSPYNAPLLRYSPHVDGHHILAPRSGAAKLSTLLAELRGSRYDAAVFLKPGWISAFIVFAAGIPMRAGTSRRPYSILFNRRVDNRRKYSGLHETDLNLTLLEAIGLPAPKGTAPVLRVDSGRAVAETTALGLPRKYVVVHFSSGGSAANWSRASYKAMVDKLSKQVSVVLTGEASQSAITMPNVFNLCGRTNFDQLVFVLSQANAFVSGSTGPLHIAAALGTPVVGIYPRHTYLGPERWGPRGNHVLALTPPAAQGHVCTLDSDGSCACMEGVPVELVLGSLGRYLGNA